MSVRRLTAAFAAAALGLTTPGLAGMFPSSTAAVDATPGYSVRHVSVAVLVGPANDQPCTVTADIYKPDAAGPRHRVPAILTTHGFGGSKDDGRQTAIAKGFVQEGYAVLTYS
ncbi:MAG: alpha/beta hydrolase family protein, partial [Actinomycetes bacterium]